MRQPDRRMQDTSEPGDLEDTSLDSGSRDGVHTHGSRRHRNNRTSSSFFLEPAVTPIRRSESGSEGAALLSRTSGSQRKGKGTSEEAVLAVPKRYATVDRRHNTTHLVGSSPLATSVTNTINHGDVSHDEAQIPPSGFSSAIPSLGAPSSIGLDTDPAQIVNLALNLSESRRRSASGIVSSGTVPRNARVVSRAEIPGDIYRFPLQNTDVPRASPQDRRIPNMSISVQGVGRHPSVATRHTSSSSIDKFSGSAMTGTNSTQHEFMPYEISSATLARAEKARKHFELLAEYLRLLPHLPPLPTLNETSVTTGNSSVLDRTSGSQGRVYNPIQYIRNRKVRFREKCPIDSEAGGWDNIDQVRSWVDVIAGSDENLTHRAEDRILLPKFEPDDTPDNRIKSAPATSNTARVLSGGDGSKPRRPRMDWITSPADFLADAAWLEEDGNKLKIEDRDGNRLFHPDTPLRPVPLTGPESLSEPTPTTEDRNLRLVERLPPHENLPHFISVSSRHHTGADRGRHGHKITGSAHLSSSDHSSRDASKSRWRKALSRSSVSFSESSNDEHETRRGRRHFPRLSRRSIENDNISLSSQKISDPSNKTTSRHIPLDSMADDVGDVITKDYTATPRDKLQPSFRPSLDTNSGREQPISQARRYVRSASSSLARSEPRREDVSFAGTVDGSPGSGFSQRQVPDVTLSASPPSPSISPLLCLVGTRKFSTGSGRINGELETALADNNASGLSHITHLARTDIPPYSSDTKLSSYSDDKISAGEAHHPESPSKGYRSQNQQESKLRGIFRSGRLAEIVGNEVSRVGDYIRKKDGSSHSRQSSTASSELFSDHVDANSYSLDEKRKQKSYVARMPSVSGTVGLSGKNPKIDVLKYNTPNLPVFASPFKNDDQSEVQQMSEIGVPIHPSIGSRRVEDDLATPSYDNNLLKPSEPNFDTDIYASREGNYSSSVASNLVLADTGTSCENGNFCLQITRDRLPVTGLTNLTVLPSGSRRPTISEATRNWSMSSRSISRPPVIDRREIARIRAHLLSAGIKALEICRQAETIRDSPPILVNNTELEPDGNIPRVPRSEEVATAARNLMSRFDHEESLVQQSMSKFSSTTSPALRSQLDSLDTFVTSTLSPRIREVTAEAERLTSELATTNTLALKQLNDSVANGLRKRRRRFRWVSRFGFVLLEWILIGAMWWMWLIVMIFKIFRGVWRGTVSGIKWILWL
ncbi:hypothetical protein PABG_00605 [Paracoccidioides brasiliensis Pb03]|nr:hypothetical protein PABG_00605 [Paracoccidioides brasiliensis Pb03]